jgi:hypothetical protein
MLSYPACTPATGFGQLLSFCLSARLKEIKRPLRPVLTQSVLWNPGPFSGFSECQSTIAAANNRAFALGF